MVELDYKRPQCKNQDIIEALKKISKNPNLLVLLGNISNSISLKRLVLKEDNKELTDEEKIIVIKDAKEDLIACGDLEEKEVEEFFEIWDKLENKNKIGTMLEYMIILNGAYEKKCFDLCIHESRVYHNTIKTDHDIDVIFFNKDQNEIDETNRKVKLKGDSEFHECKKNIGTYIPCDIKHIKPEVDRKLKFMKQAKEILKEKAMFYMPTLVYKNESRQEFLDQNGYEFIKVLGINELLNTYYHKCS